MEKAQKKGQNPKRKNKRTRESQGIFIFIHIHDISIYIYIYFRLIRARTGRFDLRYDSGVWFGGMVRGMIRGYGSRPRKPSYPAPAGN